MNSYYLKIIHFLHPCYHPNLIWEILKNIAENKCLCFTEIIWLIIIKIMVKMKNRSQRYDIMARHGYEYTKYKMCLSMMMIMCNKQHSSNIWSWIHEKATQFWRWVEKKRVVEKSPSRAKAKGKRLRKCRQSDDESKLWTVIRIRKWA